MKKPATKGARARRGATPVADLVAGLLDPILARKAGMTTGLIAAWPEIVGPRLDAVSLPEKLLWPARRSDDDPFEPATLVVACESAAALRLQHQTGELLDRINVFFGYPAVARIRIVQKAVSRQRPNLKPKLGSLASGDERRIGEMVRNIDDPKLRMALMAFGRSVLARNSGSNG